MKKKIRTYPPTILQLTVRLTFQFTCHFNLQSEIPLQLNLFCNFKVFLGGIFYKWTSYIISLWLNDVNEHKILFYSTFGQGYQNKKRGDASSRVSQCKIDRLRGYRDEKPEWKTQEWKGVTISSISWKHRRCITRSASKKIVGLTCSMSLRDAKWVMGLWTLLASNRVRLPSTPTPLDNSSLSYVYLYSFHFRQGLRCVPFSTFILVSNKHKCTKIK